MNPASLRVLLTGATGGIGRAIARRLLAEGASVMLVGRDERALSSLAEEFSFAGSRARIHAADLTRSAERVALCDAARRWQGGVNALINNAGLNPFALFEDLEPEKIDEVMAINAQAPMHLCHELLPHLKACDSMIVNIGSVLGSIGFPGQAAYSASKFALRGFTEALRRELSDSQVRVKYFAPRATRTAMNSAAVEEMNSRLGTAMDAPERVADELFALITGGRHSKVVGWPEKALVKINALMPGIVDRAVRGQLPVIREYAAANPEETLRDEHQIELA